MAEQTEIISAGNEFCVMELKKVVIEGEHSPVRPLSFIKPFCKEMLTALVNALQFHLEFKVRETIHIPNLDPFSPLLITTTLLAELKKFIIATVTTAKQSIANLRNINREAINSMWAIQMCQLLGHPAEDIKDDVGAALGFVEKIGPVILTEVSAFAYSFWGPTADPADSLCRVLASPTSGEHEPYHSKPFKVNLELLGLVSEASITLKCGLRLFARANPLAILQLRYLVIKEGIYSTASRLKKQFPEVELNDLIAAASKGFPEYNDTLPASVQFRANLQAQNEPQVEEEMDKHLKAVYTDLHKKSRNISP